MPLVLDSGCAYPWAFFYANVMKKKSNLPPVKIAVLIDGGFFVKRFNSRLDGK